MKIYIARFVLTALCAFVFSLSALAQTQPGQIKVARIEGEVSKVSGTTTTPLKNGDLLLEKDAVVTGKGASVVLVFMNGSSVKLGAETKLAIDEFKMDPLGEDLNMADYADRSKGEPTVSKTALDLAYGEMVGDVKKLNKSSNYSIKTPVGAAGIRGTIYRIVYKPASNGKAFFTISTAEGLVVMQGVSDVEIPVAADKEVVVEIDVPETPGGQAAAPVIVTQDIPAETKNSITADAAVIAQMIATSSFSSNNTSSNTQGTTEEKKTEEKKEEPTKNNTATQTNNDLTAGAGTTK